MDSPGFQFHRYFLIPLLNIHKRIGPQTLVFIQARPGSVQHDMPGAHFFGEIIQTQLTG
jgi:hypothetical protein